MKGQIHLHRKAGTANFKANPQNAGRKRGALNVKTRLNLLLEKGEKATHPITGETLFFTQAELMDATIINIVLNEKTSDRAKIKAYKTIVDRLGI